MFSQLVERWYTMVTSKSNNICLTARDLTIGYELKMITKLFHRIKLLAEEIGKLFGVVLFSAILTSQSIP